MTIDGVTNVPPHIGIDLYNSKICHGHEPLIAFTPPMTRWLEIMGFPQDAAAARQVRSILMNFQLNKFINALDTFWFQKLVSHYRKLS